VSTEREGEHLNAGTEELGLEPSIDDWPSLPDQLIQPLLAYGAVAVTVGVDTVSRTRRLTVNRYSKTYLVLPS